MRLILGLLGLSFLVGLWMRNSEFEIRVLLGIVNV